MAAAVKNQTQASNQVSWYSLLDLQGYGRFVTKLEECQAGKSDTELSVLSDADKDEVYMKLDVMIQDEITQYLYCSAELQQEMNKRKELRDGGDPGRKSRRKTFGQNVAISDLIDKRKASREIEEGCKTKIWKCAHHCRPGCRHLKCRGCVSNDVESRPTEKINKRFVCWKIEERGAVGETPLHICMLRGAKDPKMLVLAERILRYFPEIMADIYVSDRFYGENALHIALANGHVEMVNYLMGIKTVCGNLIKEKEYKELVTQMVNEPAFGTFFACKDQLAHRSDKDDGTEAIDLPEHTNYQGPLYFGEFPLSFAACLGQLEGRFHYKDFFRRLLHDYSVDPLRLDSNGNTVLHMLVIHNRVDMFDSVLSLIINTADKNTDSRKILEEKNRRGFTPLTLAAYLGFKEMYDLLLEKETDELWVYGDVMCSGVPLKDIDTIDPDGQINLTSALHLIVHGSKDEHLELLDTVIDKLILNKWEIFAKYIFYRRMICFLFYAIIYISAFCMRPGKDNYQNMAREDYVKFYTNRSSEDILNHTHISVSFHNCYLWGPPSIEQYTGIDIARLTLEGLSLIGAIIHIVLALQNIWHNGIKTFWVMISYAPSLSLMYLSCTLIILMLPLRAGCEIHRNMSLLEDSFAIFAVLTLTPHFMFFFRIHLQLGRYVSMISKMLTTDLPSFLFIYVVFLIAFSQAMYVVHLKRFNGLADPEEVSSFYSPDNALMGMVYMSLGEFADNYEDLDNTNHPAIGKIMFVLYMLLVTLLLMNMFIALMGNTYTRINSTKKESLRQRARKVLAIEMTVSPSRRLRYQEIYSEERKQKNTKSGTDDREPTKRTDKQSSSSKNKSSLSASPCSSPSCKMERFIVIRKTLSEEKKKWHKERTQSLDKMFDSMKGKIDESIETSVNDNGAQA